MESTQYTQITTNSVAKTPLTAYHNKNFVKKMLSCKTENKRNVLYTLVYMTVQRLYENPSTK